MNAEYRKVKRYLGLLDEHRTYNKKEIENVGIYICDDYKKGHTPPPLSEFKPYKMGEKWGVKKDSHAWFHYTLTLSEDMKREPLRLYIHTEKNGWDGDNPQFILYINGKLRQGFDTNHKYIDITDEEELDVYLYAYSGPEFSTTEFYTSTANVNVAVDQLCYDLSFPFESLSYLAETSKEYAEILTHLYNAVSLLDLMDVGSREFFESVKAAKKYMDEEFYGKYCRPSSPRTICIGHTHIDCAWLWTLRQTREKVQRSFATVLELMKKYPEYKFMSSQALLYKYLKEDAPELYDQVKERVKEGRWECEGSMWVEADCNLSSGESLVRQVGYGKRFFRDEFGVDTRVLWLPDVFGYSAALPQILRKSGVEWMLTSKISWNDTNTMPYDTFSWEGIDGTNINTYFLTACDKTRGEAPRYTTYTGMTSPQMIAGTYDRYQQKQLNDEALLTFGWADGGGGPTPELIEQARRGARGVPGTPTARVEFAGEFLKRLEKKIEGNKLLPRWRGELYLEFHRGTYTSIAKNKRNNRKCEFLYLDAELVSSVAKALLGKDFPKERLHEGWEDILTNQFHDIIPGSSIKEVYDRCDIDYARIKEIGDGALCEATGAIAENISKSEGYVVFNPHSFVGDGLVNINGLMARVDGVPAKGYKTVNSLDTECSVKIEDGCRRVENDKLTVIFDEDMLITSIYDKEAEREIVFDGERANEIRVYADYPDTCDAWEWQEYSKEDYVVLTKHSEPEIVKNGARVGIKLTRPHMKSTVTQTIWFTDGSKQIDFETVADWHQQHQMVKVAFPVNINSDKATYEIQFGTLERPTHENTSWDRAKFEVCAHKYADLSDGGYGVSLLNDCKYGHDIHGSTMQLSLLRCATWPNPEADQGVIEFTYSI